MRKFILTLSNNHQVFLRYLLVVNTVLLIVFMLPREAQFNYTYKVGKPWVYDDLIAPFDFAINKSEDELNKEKVERLKSVHPIYRVNELAGDQKIIRFKGEVEAVAGKADAKGKPRRDVSEQEAIGTDILQAIFSRGVILLDDRYPPGQDGMISLLSNNVESDHKVQDFFTIQSASEYIHTELGRKRGADPSLLEPLLENALTHNILFDEKATDQWTEQALESISLSRGLVQAGESVILKGEVVDQDKYQKLESLKSELKNQEYAGNSKFMMKTGQFILVSVVFTMLMIFLAWFRKDIFEDNSRLLLLMILILMVTGMFMWSKRLNLFDLYMVPVCILPIIVRAFFDTRIALFVHILALMIIGFEAPNGFEYVFIQTIAGMVAIFSIVNMSRRSQFFISVVLIFVTYMVCFIGISIIHEANFRTIDWLNMKWFLGNAVITLFAFPMIYIFEKAFGFLSDVSLMELSDTNARLLREMAFKAPGTFQHSMQVANLAEAAVQKVGGNALLVRAGALYHDIGKSDMPMYFIENQNTQINPHDELSFEESARIIRSHVIRGIEKAKKHNLPEPIVDFIRTHHGNMRLQYFYQSFLKTFPDEIPDEEQFRYQGPLPFSKETAVLMMADSVEAASRSLKNTSRETIDELVDSILQYQIEQSQFINSPITLKDISDIKRIFKKMLMSMYHARIEYPH
jgi:putative nucleotidyltransferase with HDIG domain